MGIQQWNVRSVLGAGETESSQDKQFPPSRSVHLGRTQTSEQLQQGALGAIGETTNPDMGVAWLASEPPIVIDPEPFGKKACATSRTLHRAPNHPLWKVLNRRAERCMGLQAEGSHFLSRFGQHRPREGSQADLTCSILLVW